MTSVWDLPDFPSTTFDTETLTIRPRLPDTRGSSGAPRRVYGEPVTLSAQIDPVSGEIAVMAGLEDLRAMYEIHLSSDPGSDFADGALVDSTQTGPAVVTSKLVWAPNHCVLVVQGKR
jgi:hypothetical protein